MAWQRSPEVVFEVVDGQAVLIDPDGKELLTLNAVGTLVWQELDGRRDAGDLAAALLPRFTDVTAAQLEGDIAAFLGELEAGRLVSPGDAGGG